MNVTFCILLRRKLNESVGGNEKHAIRDVGTYVHILDIIMYLVAYFMGFSNNSISENYF